MKFKTKVDLKMKITESCPGEVYQGISRCVERRSITRALAGTQLLVVLLIGVEGNYEHILRI